MLKRQNQVKPTSAYVEEAGENAQMYMMNVFVGKAPGRIAFVKRKAAGDIPDHAVASSRLRFFSERRSVAEVSVFWFDSLVVDLDCAS